MYTKHDCRESLELAKQAGIRSESWGMMNPIAGLTAIPGALVGAMTPTRTAKEQELADEDKWKNILIPGYAGYNMAKRVGTSMRGEGKTVKMNPSNLGAESIASVILSAPPALMPLAVMAWMAKEKQQKA
jgi:hypothetical protein